MAAITTAVVVGGAIAVGANTASAISNNKKAKKARIKAGEIEGAITDKENAMQAITNPYASATNPFKDLTNPYAKMDNPYANLGVATQAAEFQAEQADQALANTLDTMLRTGRGSGGATALARMALESKKGISASIEQQEANNQKLKAQGEQSRQMAVAQGESTRQMAVARGEQARQTQVAQGEQWRFAQQEERDMAKLDRLSAQMDNELQKEQAHTQMKYDAFGNIASAGMGTIGNLVGVGAISPNP